MKRFFGLGLALIIAVTTLVGCSGGSDAKHTLTVSGIDGSLNYFPIYIAYEKGWLEEADLEIEEVLFTNGPVQMEALSSDSWDIGFTGVGGVLSGVLGYDALIVGATNTDDGTQYAFARNSSDLVTSGNGQNSINADIYGSADAWKGKEILCNTGSVLHYLLIKTLGGFDLAPEDVTFIAMDVPTANSAFLAGEGDVVVLTGSAGTFPMLADSANYTPVTSGKVAETKVRCSIMANKNSYADAEKYEAMKVLLDVYFKTLDWMAKNPEESLQLMLDYSDASGNQMDETTAKLYMNADEYYTIQEAVDMLNNTVDGTTSEMEQDIINVLDFFIKYGNYSPEDQDKFKGHVDTKLMNDVYNMK